MSMDAWPENRRRIKRVQALRRAAQLLNNGFQGRRLDFRELVKEVKENGF